MEPLTFSDMDASMAETISDLACRVFDRFVAPLFNTEGVEEFKRYASATGIRKRQQQGCITILARNGEQPAGMIEIRPPSHISMFFITEAYQGKGVGRALFEKALQRVCREDSAATFITVNSSPNALSVYEHLGFQKTTNSMLEVDGIRFFPLRRPVTPSPT